MLRTVLLAVIVAAGGGAFAQGNTASGAVQGASAAAPAQKATDDLVPGTAGIQGQNIMDVKPEVKPDAPATPFASHSSSIEAIPTAAARVSTAVT